MTDYTTSEKSPSELEREAERVRAQIADTAEHIKDKMSPGQLMDEVVNYFKDGDTNQLLSNLKTQVRDNPMALALVGSGLAWLMMGSGPSSSNRGPSRANSQTPYPAATSRPTSSAGIVPLPSDRGGEHSASGGTLDKATDTIRRAGASASSSIGETATSASDAVSAAAHDVRDTATDYFSHASQATVDATTRAKNSLLDALEREPLVLGALGVAVGAAIGAMLPASRQEQEYLGPTGAKVRNAAEAAVSDGVEKIGEVASDVYAAARDEADRQGLTDSGTPVAERVSRVVQAAGSELKSATDTAARQADAAADNATDKLMPSKS